MTPKLSIIIPCFNRIQYLEASIRSVLDQQYPNLELIIIDGGSTDGSVDIIRKYEQHLAYWCSERDRGQYDALQKGFAHSTGDIMAWINSDDLYCPWAFKVVSEVFTTFPQVSWLTSLFPVTWNTQGVPVNITPRPGFSKAFFMKGYYMMHARHFRRYFIQQESTFWRRNLWDAAGGKIHPDYQVAGDFSLWARFYQHADLTGIEVPLGGFRRHGAQLSTEQRQTYIDQSEEILKSIGGQHCTPFDAWIRRTNLAKHWPLAILPSLGFSQPAQNIRWIFTKKEWQLRTEYIT